MPVILMRAVSGRVRRGFLGGCRRHENGAFCLSRMMRLSTVTVSAFAARGFGVVDDFVEPRHRCESNSAIAVRQHDFAGFIGPRSSGHNRRRCFGLGVSPASPRGARGWRQANSARTILEIRSFIRSFSIHSFGRVDRSMFAPALRIRTAMVWRRAFPMIIVFSRWPGDLETAVGVLVIAHMVGRA